MATLQHRRRRAIVILGMHRSGSSAMTRVISLLGAQLPAKLMPAYKYNTPGHWEPQEVADLNDSILCDLGSRWDDPFGPRRLAPEASETAKYVELARQVLVANYEGQGDIVLKEPRIAVLQTIWSQALVAEGFELHYIIMVRKPHEVAASLKTRDGMPLDVGFLLWTTYMLASERGTRGQSRVFVAFEQLLANPNAQIRRIQAALGFNFPAPYDAAQAEIKAFLDPQHRHEQIGASEWVDGLHPIALLDHFLQAAATDQPLREAGVSAVERWISELESSAGPLIRRSAFEALSHHAQVEARSQPESRLIDDLHALESKLAARIEQAEQQAIRIAHLEKDLAARVEHAQIQQHQLTLLNQEMVQRLETIDELRATNAELSLAEARAAEAAKRSADAALAAELAAGQRISSLGDAIADLNRQLASLEAVQAHERAARSAAEARANSLGLKLREMASRLDEEAYAASGRQARINVLESAAQESNVALQASMLEIDRLRQTSRDDAAKILALQRALKADAAAAWDRISALTHRGIELEEEIAKGAKSSAVLQSEAGILREAHDASTRKLAQLSARLLEVENRSSRWLMAELARRMTARIRGGSLREAAPPEP